jgi:hypothetical protein
MPLMDEHESYDISRLFNEERREMPGDGRGSRPVG